mgnify:CR=1 FL=1
MVGNKGKVVIDSSVALKWALDEKEDLKEALYIRELIKKRLIQGFVPSIFYYETLNTLFRKKPEKALRFLSLIRMSEILECRLTVEQVLKAGELMQKYPQISFYDACYHALAMWEDAIFITSDNKYYETTKKEGHITLLKNFTN